MTDTSLFTSSKHCELVRSAQARFSRWPETDSLTLAEFDLWLDRQYVDLTFQLDSGDFARDVYKELQAELVAIAGARVAVRLFREAMLL